MSCITFVRCSLSWKRRVGFSPNILKSHTKTSEDHGRENCQELVVEWNAGCSFRASTMETSIVYLSIIIFCSERNISETPCKMFMNFSGKLKAVMWKLTNQVWFETVGQKSCYERLSDKNRWKLCWNRFSALLLIDIDRWRLHPVPHVDLNQKFMEREHTSCGVRMTEIRQEALREKLAMGSCRTRVYEKDYKRIPKRKLSIYDVCIKNLMNIKSKNFCEKKRKLGRNVNNLKNARTVVWNCRCITKMSDKKRKTLRNWKRSGN